MICGRCKTPMNLKRRRDTKSTFINYILDDPKERVRPFLYACPNCGNIVPAKIDDVELEAKAQKLEDLIKTVDDFSHEGIELSLNDVVEETDIDDILKLHPGASLLNDVFEKIGRPYSAERSNHGISLYYHSAEESYPHIVLIDPRYQLVKMIAIHNDHLTFELERLVNAYGSPEFAAQFEWQEHWLFESPGVAYIAEERVDEHILYLQYFETRIGFNRYLELEGYSGAIFPNDA